MPPKKIDHGSMAEIHRLLHEAADQVDQAAASMPDAVYAGPLADKVAKMAASLTVGSGSRLSGSTEGGWRSREHP